MDIFAIKLPKPISFGPNIQISTTKSDNGNKNPGCPPEGGILIVTGPLNQDTFETSKQNNKLT